MTNISFSQKNNLLVKYKSGKHFGKDLELFKKHFPNSNLNNRLARANQFTFDSLDGEMIYLLLDKVSIAEILANREGKEPETTVMENPKIVNEPETKQEQSETTENANPENGNENDKSVTGSQTKETHSETTVTEPAKPADGSETTESASPENGNDAETSEKKSEKSKKSSLV